MEFGYLLERAANRYPAKTAIVFEHKRFTFAQFNARVNRLANALLDLGVRHQDRIGLVCHNSNSYLEIVFACARIGAVSTHFNWRLPAQELQALIDEAECRLVFMSTGLAQAGALLSWNERVEIIGIGEVRHSCRDYEALLQAYAPAAPDIAVAENDLVLQLYTSGTTGRPKGVMFTHKNTVSHCLANIIDTEWTENDTFLFALPLFHASASGVYNSIACGSTTVIQNGFRSETYLRAVAAERVTAIGIIPTMLSSLLEYPELRRFDLSSLRKVIYGSAPIRVELLQKCLGLFRCQFYQLFGMTEMSPVVCVLSPRDHLLNGQPPAAGGGPYNKLGSVGQAAIGSRIRIVDEHHADCPRGAIGEIIVKGPGMMHGYYKREAETRGAVKNGWYYTGDLGYFDADGYLYVVDRKTDMLISGGENIYPKEIENCILQLQDDIADVAVIGVPDDKWGEAVKALVIKKQNSAITAQAVIMHCENNMASYKKPKSVEFVEALPRNSTGKIQKNILKEAYWQGTERRI